MASTDPLKPNKNSFGSCPPAPADASGDPSDRLGAPSRPSERSMGRFQSLAGTGTPATKKYVSTFVCLAWFVENQGDPKKGKRTKHKKGPRILGKSPPPPRANGAPGQTGRIHFSDRSGRGVRKRGRRVGLLAARGSPSHQVYFAPPPQIFCSASVFWFLGGGG